MSALGPHIWWLLPFLAVALLSVWVVLETYEP